VGIDGSPHSLIALRWAALTAQRDGADLDVMFVYHWRMPGVRRATSRDIEEAAAGLATEIVDAAAAQARTIAPHLRASGRAVLGDPEPVLLRAAEQADLLVVGNRGRGGNACLLAGSVSVRLATHAPCPVAVVRGRSDVEAGRAALTLAGLAASPRSSTANPAPACPPTRRSSSPGSPRRCGRRTSRSG